MKKVIFEEEIRDRLTKLRLKKGVSSREMSLSIGQNEGYINRIECGKTLPSMNAFLFICDYLSVSPSEFFEMENNNPEKIKKLDEKLKKLNDKQLDLIYQIICEFEN